MAKNYDGDPEKGRKNGAPTSKVIVKDQGLAIVGDHYEYCVEGIEYSVKVEGRRLAR